MKIWKGRKRGKRLQCRIKDGIVVVLSCALLLVFSGLKLHISVIQYPKYTQQKRLQTSSHLCTTLPNPYIYWQFKRQKYREELGIAVAYTAVVYAEV